MWKWKRKGGYVIAEVSAQQMTCLRRFDHPRRHLGAELGPPYAPSSLLVLISLPGLPIIILATGPGLGPMKLFQCRLPGQSRLQ